MFSPLAPHQSRVCVEFMELSAALSKLTAFFNTVTYSTLPYIEQSLLLEQVTHMTAYETTLRRRLSLWGVDLRATGMGMVLIKDGLDVTLGHTQEIPCA